MKILLVFVYSVLLRFTHPHNTAIYSVNQLFGNDTRGTLFMGLVRYNVKGKISDSRNIKYVTFLWVAKPMV